VTSSDEQFRNGQTYARARAGKKRSRFSGKHGSKYTGSKKNAMYRRAVRAAKAAPAWAAKRRKKTGPKHKKVQTVTAAQVISMAKKGALQRWLCQGRARTGCGSSGRVVSGRGSFRRVR
jgi:hypothetical protein